MNTTNLIAAIVVALSTNTVEKITGYAAYEPDWEAMRSTTLAIYATKGVGPNEKTITTTAKRTTTITFDWMGKARSVEHVEVLWESNKVVRLEWREVPAITGALLGLVATNLAWSIGHFTNTQPSIIFSK